MKHVDGPSCDLCNFKLTMAHEGIATWFKEAKKTYINLHVSWTFRDEHSQNKAFKDGASTLKWPLSAHNHTVDDKPCAKAADVFLIDDDGLARFPHQFYSLLWGWTKDKFGKSALLWGGDYKSFGDSGHFQLRDQLTNRVV